MNNREKMQYISKGILVFALIILAMSVADYYGGAYENEVVSHG